MSCGIDHRCGLDSKLLWLRCRLTATALIRPLTWEHPCALVAALKRQKYIYIMFSMCFAARPYRVGTQPHQREWPCQASSPGTIYSASQHQATMAWSCVCDHLCLLSIFFFFFFFFAFFRAAPMAYGGSQARG